MPGQLKGNGHQRQADPTSVCSCVRPLSCLSCPRRHSAPRYMQGTLPLPCVHKCVPICTSLRACMYMCVRAGGRACGHRAARPAGRMGEHVWVCGRGCVYARACTDAQSHRHSRPWHGMPYKPRVKRTARWLESIFEHPYEPLLECLQTCKHIRTHACMHA